jgi:cytochrome d ubiquinol oxidase subunit II
MTNVIWFWVLAGMLTAYSVLDGFDLGVGALHLWIARDNRERRIALNAIGPVWNGNEVWLIAAGGMMVVSFPGLYAAAFSGFYLALMIVLWLLILRGVSIEVRGQIDHPLWRSFWDACFWIGSLLLALLLGVALGNVLRGLPVQANHLFQGTFALPLNPYALLTGVLSVAVLAWHGANYLRLKTEGELLERVRRWSSGLYWIMLALVIVSTLVTFMVRPALTDNYRQHPAGLLLPLIGVAGLVLGFFGSRHAERDRAAFRGSVLTIIGLLAAAAFSVFPNLVVSTLNPAWSLNIYNTASTRHAQFTALIANLVGMLGVVVYSTYIYRIFRGKVRPDQHGY